VQFEVLLFVAPSTRSWHSRQLSRVHEGMECPPPLRLPVTRFVDDTGEATVRPRFRRFIVVSRACHGG
jgi:hypothetical protein